MNCFIDQPLVKKSVCSVESGSDKTGPDKPSCVQDNLVMRPDYIIPSDVNSGSANLSVKEQVYE